MCHVTTSVVDLSVIRGNNFHVVILVGAEGRTFRERLPFEPAIGPVQLNRQPGLQLHLPVKVSGALLSPSPSKRGQAELSRERFPTSASSARRVHTC